MALIPMRVLLDHAAENNYGVAAFNVNNMEQIQSIMMAAVETESPVIVQASRGARSYSNDNYLRHLMIAAAELASRVGRSLREHRLRDRHVMLEGNPGDPVALFDGRMRFDWRV